MSLALLVSLLGRCRVRVCNMLRSTRDAQNGTFCFFVRSLTPIVIVGDAFAHKQEQRQRSCNKRVGCLLVNKIPIVWMNALHSNYKTRSLFQGAWKGLEYKATSHHLEVKSTCITICKVRNLPNFTKVLKTDLTLSHNISCHDTPTPNIFYLIENGWVVFRGSFITLSQVRLGSYVG